MNVHLIKCLRLIGNQRMFMQSEENYKKWWIRILITLIFAIILVGGVTRLTRSGLSIVEWRPISGAIPPLNEAEWVDSFNLYKKSPEFLKINSHFELGDFKRIYFWEYLHRNLARFIFLWSLIPALTIWKKKWIDIKIAMTMPLLVALQGVVGWFMVKSGLNIEPHVSHYMLALHFFTALSILLFAHFHLSKMRSPLVVQLQKTDKIMFYLLGILLLMQVFYGCLVGGLKAGFMYNTFPLMGGSFYLRGTAYMEPFYLNFFENPTMVQWVHRWLGILAVIFMAYAFYNFIKKSRNVALQTPLLHFLGVMVFQAFLGILTLLHFVPIVLAATHQLIGAMLVVTYAGIIFRLQITKSDFE